jgi:hypothetical protein
MRYNGDKMMKLLTLNLSFLFSPQVIEYVDCFVSRTSLRSHKQSNFVYQLKSEAFQRGVYRKQTDIASMIQLSKVLRKCKRIGYAVHE